LLSVLGYGFAGDGFNCCRWVEIDGIWLIWSLIFGCVQWVLVGCGVGFRLISVGVWLAVGCGVARGGLRGGFQGGFGWLAVVVPIFGGFQWFWVWFFLLFCFTLLQTHNVEYFPKHFPRMQTNTRKTIIFPKIIYIYKYFTVKNILYQNK
jgi:hypothetical protein